MKILYAPERRNPLIPSRTECYLTALAATALDPNRTPTLAKHWPGIKTIDGRIVIPDRHHLTQKFPTKPVLEIVESNNSPGQADTSDQLQGGGK
jgi:hypothetical protein